jgi:twinkle protein
MLSKRHIDWLTSRGIDPETAIRFGIFSRDDALVFPYIDRGEGVNEKVRRPNKQFHQIAGGKKTFWNADILDDVALQDAARAKLIITEGEMDALTAIECGFPFAVSVPDGAPATPTESDRKYEYVIANWDRLDKVAAIILATDGDAPGGYLRNELARRLGPERCWSVTYPQGAKDLNEVLQKFGVAEVARVLNEAKPYPVKGLYKLSDYPDLPPFPTYSTGWPGVDEHFKITPGTLTVVTGIPSHGKSTVITAMALNAADRHNWSILLSSFELPPVPYHRDVIRQYRSGKPAKYMDAPEKAKADAWADEHIVFLAEDPEEGDGDFTLENLIDKAEIAVVRHGIRIWVLDPWNQIEHLKRPDETETDYTAKALRMLRRFARRFDVAVFLVAHPMKMATKGEAAKPPTLYDIAGSAHFYNNPDFGLTIWRPDLTRNDTDIIVRKVRFQETGKPGVVPMLFMAHSGQFVVNEAREAA